MKEKEIERILKSLANKRRLAIVSVLSKGKDRSVGEIAEDIKLSFKATSKHLSILTNADVLEKEQRSAQIFYSINKEAPDIVKLLLKSILTT